MTNFGINDTLYKYPSNINYTGGSSTTNPIENSANQDTQIPVLTSSASECSESLGRYQVKLNSQNNKGQSLEQYADNLRKQGKQEGKDFKIEQSPKYNNFNLYEYDKDGRKIKTIYWTNGNKESNYAGYSTTEYKDGVTLIKDYRPDGSLQISSEQYPNIPEKNSEEAKLLNTSVEDYCKNLESQGKVQNKDYKMEKKQIGDNEQIFVDEFSPNGVREKTLWWIIGQDGRCLSVSYCDKKGETQLRNTYYSDNSYEITKYT